MTRRRRCSSTVPPSLVEVGDGRDQGVRLVDEELGADRRVVVRPHVRHPSAVAVLADLDDVADVREFPVLASVLAGAGGFSVGLNELHVEGLHGGKHRAGAA